MNKNAKIALIVGGIILGAIIIVPLVLGAALGWPYGGWRMMWPGMMTGSSWMWLVPVFLVVCLGLIIWAIVAAVSGSDGSKGSETLKTESALEMLKRRYARGEISKAEYEEKKKDLA